MKADQTRPDRRCAHACWLPVALLLSVWAICTAPAQGQNLYWIEGTSPATVERGDLGGLGAQSLVTTGVALANSLAIDLAAEKIYIGGSGIEEAPLVGGTATSLVPAAGFAIDLEIDYRNGKLYWTDSTCRCVSRSNLDGTSVETVYAAPIGQTPTGVTLAPAAGHVYWTDNDDDSIRRADLDGSNVVVVRGPGGPLGNIEADERAQWLYWTEDADVVRADLALASSTVVATGSTDAHYLAVDRSAGTVYWNDWPGDLPGANDPLFRRAIGSGPVLTLPSILSRGLDLDVAPREIRTGDPVLVEGALRRLVRIELETGVPAVVPGSTALGALDIDLSAAREIFAIDFSGFVWRVGLDGTATPIAGPLASLQRLAVHPDGTTAYVLAETPVTLIEIDVATGSTTAVPGVTGQLTDLDVDAATGDVLVTDAFTGEVLRVEVPTGSTSFVTDGLMGPQHVGVTPDGATAFVIAGTPFALHRVTTATGATQVVPTPGISLTDISVPGNGSVLTAGSFGGVVWSIDGLTGLATRISGTYGGPQRIASAPQAVPLPVPLLPGVWALLTMAACLAGGFALSAKRARDC